MKMNSILWANRFPAALYKGALVVGGSLFLAAASQIAMPWQPVPLTLQTFAVLFIGMTYGSRLGLATVFLYLLEGACGLPVFANLHAGLPILLGPTGGYLIGFLPAAFVSGYLAEKGFAKNSFSAAIAALPGFALIFASGIPVLAIYVGWHMALTMGVLPFITGEVVKLVLLAVLVPLFWKKLES
jgi:biotin transport system substrate-specific component